MVLLDICKQNSILGGMGRIAGAKNKIEAIRRKPVQIRLSEDELAAMREVAQQHGLEFGTWARVILRQAAGIGVALPDDNK
jgi:hypothetical protein